MSDRDTEASGELPNEKGKPNNLPNEEISKSESVKSEHSDKEIISDRKPKDEREEGRPKEKDKEGKLGKEGKKGKDKGPKPLKYKKQKPKDWSIPDLAVTSSPHVFAKDSIKKIMWIVFATLLPAYIWGVLYFTFGIQLKFLEGSLVFTYKEELLAANPIYLSLLYSKPLQHLLVGVLVSMITEWLINVFRKQRVTAWDGSAAVTGILIAMMNPPYVPLFVTIISCIFAIVIIKHLFGGLGTNFLNPAIAGRVFAMVSWPGLMYTQEYYLVHGTTGATALEMMKQYINPVSEGVEPLPYDSYSLFDLFLGNVGGSIGEVSFVLLFLGGIYLYIKNYITWEIPLTYVVTVFLFAYIIGDGKGEHFNFAMYNILSGGLILGALFMATDMVTSPLTRVGQIIFGTSCGLLTVLIRLYGGYPEGVAFAILIMNFFTPLIDKYTAPRIFGHKKRTTI